MKFQAGDFLKHQLLTPNNQVAERLQVFFDTIYLMFYLLKPGKYVYRIESCSRDILGFWIYIIRMPKNMLNTI